MTEAAWLRFVDPGPMLRFLRGRASERKVRLFACACCRRHWDDLGTLGRETVQTVERFLDGHASAAEMGRVAGKAREAAHAPLANHDVVAQATYGVAYFDGEAFAVAGEVAFFMTEHARLEGLFGKGRTIPGWPHPLADADNDRCRAAGLVAAMVERIVQCGLLREIVGDPFRGPRAVHPRWLTPQVLALARATYDEGDFARTGRLADALFLAGCTDADLLAHCRGPGPHVRGCWAIDSLLGKV